MLQTQVIGCLGLWLTSEPSFKATSLDTLLQLATYHPTQHTNYDGIKHTQIS